MAEQGKQMRVGAREGFAHNSVKMVSLADDNRYEVDSNTFFFLLAVKLVIHFKYCPVPTLTFYFDTHSYLRSVPVIP
jgi:hypothetical protein